jgi:hypothetical protein
MLLRTCEMLGHNQGAGADLELTFSVIRPHPLRGHVRSQDKTSPSTPTKPEEKSGEDRVQRVADVDHAADVSDVVATGDRRVAVTQDVPGGVQPPAMRDQGARRAT